MNPITLEFIIKSVFITILMLGGFIWLGFLMGWKVVLCLFLILWGNNIQMSM